jgi:hypothetical protein
LDRRKRNHRRRSGQTQSTSLYGTSVMPDLSATYYVRDDYPPDHPDRVANALEYFASMSELTERLLRLQAVALRLLLSGAQSRCARPVRHRPAPPLSFGEYCGEITRRNFDFTRGQSGSINAPSSTRAKA